MKSLITFLLIWTGFAQSSSFGASVIIPISSKTLKQSNFVFEFSLTPASEGVDALFKAVLTRDTLSTFTGSLGIVEITSNTRQIKGVREILINKKGSIYTAHFHIEPDLMNTKDICFIFTENVQVMMNGNVTPMPSATFYTIPLKDFHP